VVSEHAQGKHADDRSLPVPMPDYAEEHGPVLKVAAGALGAVLTFGVVTGAGYLLRGRRRDSEHTPPSP
jgi:hypothetical protein